MDKKAFPIKRKTRLSQRGFAFKGAQGSLTLRVRNRGSKGVRAKEEQYFALLNSPAKLNGNLVTVGGRLEGLPPRVGGGLLQPVYSGDCKEGIPPRVLKISATQVSSHRASQVFVKMCRRIGVT